ncbi:MAG: ABC transporter ATP-binding protein [Gammaproteobacteria bacterium]|nr:ABC transporter ATP-binding protein [Gammaproteobacteria bacterium]MDH5731222.1 ABC transporter ATP-binding protein [Gammaproteobacteria bacterium]
MYQYQSILNVEAIDKFYQTPEGKIAVVQSISFSINAGEIVAFLGPNGAGKTTCIKIIAGLIRPDHGSVNIAGRSPHSCYQALADVGAVLEGNRNIYWRLTVQENLDYFAVLRGVKSKAAKLRSQALLQRFDLLHKRHAQVQSLSRGMQQKVAIAMSLMHEPKLLLLDEPTLGLDVESAQAIKDLVKEIADEGRAVLLTTHQLDLAEAISHRVVIVNQGQVIRSGFTNDLIADSSTDIFQIDLETPLPKSKSENLQQYCFDDGMRLLVPGGMSKLYAVLHQLEPLPIISVCRADANLSDVFMKIIREERHRESV